MGDEDVEKKEEEEEAPVGLIFSAFQNTYIKGPLLQKNPEESFYLELPSLVCTEMPLGSHPQPQAVFMAPRLQLLKET